MAVANKAKYAILGSLSLMPMSGYDIKKFSDGSIAHFWNENYARIYPVLKQMEKEGLVIKETMHTEGRPSRNLYSITGKGRSQLDLWLLQPVEDIRPREELLLKLFFSENVPAENLIEKLTAEKYSVETKVIAPFFCHQSFCPPE
jgi:DNA-binding PadR family transcriptional regulator